MSSLQALSLSTFPSVSRVVARKHNPQLRRRATLQKHRRLSVLLRSAHKHTHARMHTYQENTRRLSALSAFATDAAGSEQAARRRTRHETWRNSRASTASASPRNSPPLVGGLRSSPPPPPPSPPPPLMRQPRASWQCHFARLCRRRRCRKNASSRMVGFVALFTRQKDPLRSPLLSFFFFVSKMTQ